MYALRGWVDDLTNHRADLPVSLVEPETLPAEAPADAGPLVDAGSLR
jgi:hypothetical protein